MRTFTFLWFHKNQIKTIAFQDLNLKKQGMRERDRERERENDSVIMREGDKSSVIKRENEYDKKELERQCDKERGK